MTPEVRDLGEEFRKAKLEEVTIDYLSRAVTDPTVVVIEDAHWMDEGSAGLLRADRRSDRGPPVARLRQPPRRGDGVRPARGAPLHLAEAHPAHRGRARRA